MMDGICGLCPKSCALCKRVLKRQYKPIYYGKGRWSDPSPMVSDEEAVQILGCRWNSLGRYIRSGKIACNKNIQRNRLSFNDVVALKQELFIQATDVQEVNKDIVTIIQKLADIRAKAQNVIDEWLFEFGLKDLDALFRYGKQTLLSTPPGSGWYVYHLCFMDNQPFYIGKGCGRRMYDHEADARRGIKNHKCNTIRRVWARGEKVRYHVVFVTPSEEEAYAFERLEIAKYKPRLTNVELGGPVSVDMSRRMGLNVPIEYLNYKQFDAHLSVNKKYIKDRNQAMQTWALLRTYALSDLRRLAREVCYWGALTIIDSEVDALSYLGVEQELLGLSVRSKGWYMDLSDG